MRERAMLEASLAQFEQENMRRIARTMADSERPQAQRIARKLVDYTGEIEQIRSLQREIAKLQAAQRTRLAGQEREQDVRTAAAELSDFLRDEEDAMHALMALDEIEAGHLFGVIGVKLH